MRPLVLGLVLLAPSLSLAAPHLKVKLTRGTSYQASAPTTVTEGNVDHMRVRIGKKTDSIIGSYVTLKRFNRGRSPQVAHLEFDVVKEVRDAKGVRLSSTTRTMKDTVKLSGAVDHQTKIYRGESGAAVIAQPMFSFEVGPAGIPHDQIEKVDYLWAERDGGTYAPMRTIARDPAKPAPDFSMRGYTVREPLPLTATVTMKDGSVHHMDTIVGK